jgi:hypothetical protein
MPTIRVGKALLLRRWDDAVAAAMSPDEAQSGTPEQKAKAAFQEAWAAAAALPVAERDAHVRAAAAEALKVLPAQCVAEAELLGGLSRGLRAQVCVQGGM